MLGNPAGMPKLTNCVPNPNAVFAKSRAAAGKYIQQITAQDYQSAKPGDSQVQNRGPGAIAQRSISRALTSHSAGLIL